MSLTSAEKKQTQRSRIADAGGTTLTTEIGAAANTALTRSLVLLDRARGHAGKKTTKRMVLEAALVAYAGELERTAPAQKAVLLAKKKATP